jgi:hypothetical protein
MPTFLLSKAPDGRLFAIASCALNDVAHYLMWLRMAPQQWANVAPPTAAFKAVVYPLIAIGYVPGATQQSDSAVNPNLKGRDSAGRFCFCHRSSATAVCQRPRPPRFRRLRLLKAAAP